MMKQGAKILVYGPPGVGKTDWVADAGKFELTFPCLFVDFEGGSRSLRDRMHPVDLKKWEEPVPGKVDYYRITQYKQLNAVYELLYTTVFDPNKLPKDAPHYRSLVLDSLSEIGYLAVEHVTGQAAPKLTEVKMAEIQQYGTANAMMKKLVRLLRDLPEMHVFLTAHEQFKEMGDEKTTLVLPSFVGKLSHEVPALVDFVWYLRTQPKGSTLEREFITQQRGQLYAKSRDERRVIPPVLKGATLETFLKYAGE